MRRIHLFEFTDQPWYPDTFRRIQTDYLQFAASRGTADKYLFPLIQKGMQAADTQEIVDLCSGGAGPWIGLQRQFTRVGQPVRITLTDKYPNPSAVDRCADTKDLAISYFPEPVDAMCVPPEMKGMRTIFEGFHHFKPREAGSILQDAYSHRFPIGVFEINVKAPFGLVLLLISPLMTLVSYVLLTPFITPRTFSRYLWTYLIPLVPLATCWDGVISLLRVYSTGDLHELVEPFDTDDYAWEIGRASTGTTIFEYTYLIGYPIRQAEVACPRQTA